PAAARAPCKQGRSHFGRCFACPASICPDGPLPVRGGAGGGGRCWRRSRCEPREQQREGERGPRGSVAWRLPGKAATGGGRAVRRGPAAEAAPGRGRAAAAAALPGAARGRARPGFRVRGGGKRRAFWAKRHCEGWSGHLRGRGAPSPPGGGSAVAAWGGERHRRGAGWGWTGAAWGGSAVASG
ncbi:unnamed protein product, partial [Bubo scandiacus]